MEELFRLDRRRFAFNRFLDEAYLYSREEADYRVFTGLATDLLHLLSLQAMDSSTLQLRLSQLLDPVRIAPSAVQGALRKLQEQGTLEVTRARWRTSAIAGGEDVVAHVRRTRQVPIFYVPLAANLFVNGKCNQKCEFCFLDFDRMASEHNTLDDDQWLELTDRLIEAGLTIFNIGGMEPFVSFARSMKILERAKRAGCSIGLITNGSIPLKQDQLEWIAELEPMVGVSLQNDDPTVHDEAAVLPGAFERCIRNVKRMIEAGVHVDIQSVALRENTDELADFVGFVERLGAKSFTMQNVFGGPWCGEQDFFSTAMRPEEFQGVVDGLRQVQTTTKLKMMMDLFPHQREEGHYTGNKKGMRMRAMSTCSAGKTAIQVSPRGDLSPCPHTVAYREHAVGNLLASPVLELWHDTPRFGAFRRWRREDYKSTACTTCSEFDACRGGCLITAKYANGGYLNGDPRCSKVAAGGRRPELLQIIQ